MPEELLPGPKVRSLSLEFSRSEDGKRTVSMSVSSDTRDVLRYVEGVGGAWEVLDHSSMANIDLSRFAGEHGGPLLLDHDRSQLIGRFVPTGVRDGKLQGIGRFGNGKRAADAYQDVQDAVLVDTSCFYTYSPSDVEVIGHKDGYPIALVRKWGLTEVSLVAVPADINTGVGRALPDPAVVPALVPDPNEEEENESSNTDGQVVPESVTNDTDDDDPEDASMRGGHQPDCEDPDCTEEDPCEDCQGRCQKRTTPAVEETAAVADQERAAQAPGASATAPASVTGQRSATTPTITGGSTRKAVIMTPEEIAAAQAATSTNAPNDVSEALQIRAIAEQLGHGRKAEEILTSGLSLGEARAAIMQHLHANAASSRASVKSLEELGASKAEVKEFNYGRACLNAVAVAEDRGRGESNFEREVSDTLEKGMPSNYKRHGGIFLPYAVGKARNERSSAMDTQTATQGAEAVFTQSGQVIDVLRNALVTAKLGATIYTGLDAPLGLPRQDTDVVANWQTEDGGVDAAETEMATSLVTLTPKTLMATTATTRQLLELAVKQFELQGRIMNSIAYASQKAIDYAAMFGTGISPIPQGIWTAAGVNAVPFGAATGVVPTAPFAYQDIIKMITGVAAANIPFGKPGFVTTPQMAGVLSSVLKFSVNGASQLWEGSILEGMMAGFPAVTTNQCPANLGTGTNTHGFIFGAWENLLIGIFGSGFEVIVDQFSLKKRGIVEITSFNMADVKLAHAAAFSIGQYVAITGTAQTVS